MEPLASLLRPSSLKDYIGQSHLVGEGKPLNLAIAKKHAFSFILWGPPGTGKTSLARIYAKALNADYHELSAVSSGKEDIRRILEGGNLFGPKIIFLDEIHRFNKAQQDFLLPYVEKGDLILIGATTENPSFEVIPALLSRTRVFILESLSEDNVREIIARAGQKINQTLDEESVGWLIRMAGGDARQMLGVLEHAHELYGTITLENLEATLQSSLLRYDKKGEDHYNTISAFIKSMRASQPDAALYYLGRMVASGEDPKFIARRMVIFASEDVGLADPMALVIANEVFKAVETIGVPECGINLAHGVAYLSKATKSRASYDAYNQALFDAKKLGNLPIPMKLRNAPTKLMKDIGYGDGYEMYGDEGYLPKELEGKKYLVG
jgi:putative ATPase